MSAYREESELQTRIDALIDEVGVLVSGLGPHTDSEFDRQLEAFRERARQAQQLALQARLTAGTDLRILDGYLHRAVTGLELSRDYFSALQCRESGLADAPQAMAAS